MRKRAILAAMSSLRDSLLNEARARAISSPGFFDRLVNRLAFEKLEIIKSQAGRGRYYFPTETGEAYRDYRRAVIKYRNYSKKKWPFYSVCDLDNLFTQKILAKQKARALAVKELEEL